MTGINLLPKCPICGSIFPVSLYTTQYVKVNGSRDDYVRCTCIRCNKEFWMAHDECGKVARTMPVREDDRTKNSMLIFR